MAEASNSEPGPRSEFESDETSKSDLTVKRNCTWKCLKAICKTCRKTVQTSRRLDRHLRRDHTSQHDDSLAIYFEVQSVLKRKIQDKKHRLLNGNCSAGKNK